MEQPVNPHLLQQAKELDVDEQIELVEAIWDGIVSRGAAPPLTLAQKTALERRHVSLLANQESKPASARRPLLQTFLHHLVQVHQLVGLFQIPHFHTVQIRRTAIA